VPPTEPEAADANEADTGAGADADADALAALREKRRPPPLAPGAIATFAVEVTPDLTAASVGSGALPVLASPAIVRLVEQAAVALVRGRLPDSLTTVGTSFGLQHEAPTPVGATVRFAVRLDAGEERTLTFRFTVNDGTDDVARGSHVRVIVERDRFMASAEARDPA
jgi:fluoroacetyl-CoA thioesterase